MTIELSGKDLGIADCDWSASGETPADVVRQVVEHLRQEHDIDMPSAEAIIEGKATEEPIMKSADETVRLVVRRLHADLDLPSPDTGTETRPAVRKVTGR